jgi:hypothetical protein
MVYVLILSSRQIRCVLRVSIYGSKCFEMSFNIVPIVPEHFLLFRTKNILMDFSCQLFDSVIHDLRYYNFLFEIINARVMNMLFLLKRDDPYARIIYNKLVIG